MSHFSVLVIGEDVDAQLQPFHEFECTGHVDQYVVDVDQTADVQARINDGESLEDALGWFGLEDRIIADASEADRLGAHKFGFAVVVEGRLVQAVDRTNPNKKWDWWVIGGRASGKLLRRNGTRVDSARVGDIDIEAAQDAAEAKAKARWSVWVQCLAAGEPPAPWPQWVARVEAGEITIEQARAEFNANPVMLAARARWDVLGWDAADYLGQKGAAYRAAARASAMATYAVLKDGVWSERGEMGWFGMARNEKDAHTWTEQVHALWSSLTPDTLVTVVDCHI